MKNEDLWMSLRSSILKKRAIYNFKVILTPSLNPSDSAELVAGRPERGAITPPPRHGGGWVGGGEIKWTNALPLILLIAP